MTKEVGQGQSLLSGGKPQADTPVNEPLVEAIMISAASAQGISWKSRGREILE